MTGYVSTLSGVHFACCDEDECWEFTGADRQKRSEAWVDAESHDDQSHPDSDGSGSGS